VEEARKNVRGTYDYLPEEHIIRNVVMEALRRTFESYGFNSIETPILCMKSGSKY
jgi:histidyl-tRNA synthetase